MSETWRQDLHRVRRTARRLADPLGELRRTLAVAEALKTLADLKPADLPLIAFDPFGVLPDAAPAAASIETTPRSSPAPRFARFSGEGDRRTATASGAESGSRRRDASTAFEAGDRRRMAPASVPAEAPPGPVFSLRGHTPPRRGGHRSEAPARRRLAEELPAKHETVLEKTPPGSMEGPRKQSALEREMSSTDLKKRLFSDVASEPKAAPERRPSTTTAARRPREVAATAAGTEPEGRVTEGPGKTLVLLGVLADEVLQQHSTTTAAGPPVVAAEPTAAPVVPLVKRSLRGFPAEADAAPFRDLAAAAEDEPDPEALADAVNKVLIEQARRNGVDLS